MIDGRFYLFARGCKPNSLLALNLLPEQFADQFGLAELFFANLELPQHIVFSVFELCSILTQLCLCFINLLCQNNLFVLLDLNVGAFTVKFLGQFALPIFKDLLHPEKLTVQLSHFVLDRACLISALVLQL